MNGKISRRDDVFVFRISGPGNGFRDMPLERAAKYLANVGKIAGPGAVFHSMTAREIRFVDGSK